MKRQGVMTNRFLPREMTAGVTETEREREIRSRIGGGRVIERQQIEDQDLSLRSTLIDNDDEDKECVAAAGVCAVWHCGESCRGSSLHGAAGESFA